MDFPELSDHGPRWVLARRFPWPEETADNDRALLPDTFLPSTPRLETIAIPNLDGFTAVKLKPDENNPGILRGANERYYLTIDCNQDPTGLDLFLRHAGGTKRHAHHLIAKYRLID